MASRRNRTKSIVDEISQLHAQQLASARQAKESYGLVVDIADQIRNLCREILKTNDHDKKLERLCQLRFLLHEQAQETQDKSSEALESLLESERHIKDNYPRRGCRL